MTDQQRADALGCAGGWVRTQAVRDAGYRTSLFGKTHLHPHAGDRRKRESLMQDYGLDDVDGIGDPRASARVLAHMTARWQRTPGTVRMGGATSDTPAEWIDVGATLADAASAPLECRQFARSLLPTVADPLEQDNLTGTPQASVLAQKSLDILPPIHPGSRRCAHSVGPTTHIDRAPCEPGVGALRAHTPEFVNVSLRQDTSTVEANIRLHILEHLLRTQVHAK